MACSERGFGVGSLGWVVLTADDSGTHLLGFTLPAVLFF